MAKRRLPMWLIGLMAGAAVWSTALAIALTINSSRGRELSSLVEAVAVASNLIAYPLAAGGWFFVWPYDVPPFRWLENYALNGAMGLVLASVLGMAVAWAAGKLSRGNAA